jgi:hypothetical protein
MRQPLGPPDEQIVMAPSTRQKQREIFWGVVCEGLAVTSWARASRLYWMKAKMWAVTDLDKDNEGTAPE